MKLAALMLAAALAGQAGNRPAGVVLNGREVPVVGYSDGGRVNWTTETQDWGGHPPTASPRTPAEPADLSWYTIQVNGTPTVVKGYVDASNRLVWRWRDQAGGARPNSASISAFDPRANGVDYQGLAPGVQASDAATKAEVEAVMARASSADPGRVPLPDVIGVGVDWAKVAACALLALTVLVVAASSILLLLILSWRLARAKR